MRKVECCSNPCQELAAPIEYVVLEMAWLIFGQEGSFRTPYMLYVDLSTLEGDSMQCLHAHNVHSIEAL